MFEKENIFFIAYADDIVIATLGESEIKKAIKITEMWAKKYQMKFN